MNIENIRYHILSQNSKHSETEPRQGEIVTLRVTKTLSDQVIEQASILPDYVAKEGPYREVVGLGQTNSTDSDLRCVAHYDVERVYPKNELIGELVFKREVNKKLRN